MKDAIIHECRQNSDEWRSLRSGRIGGTSAATLLVNGKADDGLGVGAKSVVYRKAAEFITGPAEDDGYMSAAMQRGHDLEPVARRRYENETFQSVREVGYISRGEFLGVSPDGLVGEDGGIEIKCLNAEEHARFFDTRFFDKKYYYQCQWAMFLSGRTWWDFVMYHPEFGDLDIIIERLQPDAQAFKTWAKKIPVYLAEIQRVLWKIDAVKQD